MSVVMMINILLMGYFNDNGVIAFNPSSNSLDSAILVCILLSMSCFWIWRLASQHGKTLEDLQLEHAQVLAREEEIQKLARTDSLTGLPNRAMAKILFNQAIKVADREDTKFALMFLDLDDFKTINDTLGHEIGDEYLVSVSRRLEQALRKTDAICRLGGDEFLVILQHGNTRDTIGYMADKIVSAIEKPTTVAGNEVSGSVTIGIAMVPDDGNDFDTICRKADLAMYHGKSAGKNTYHYFDESMSSVASDALSIISDLRNNRLDNGFRLVYQPKVDLTTYEATSAEALIRWNHPERGDISPADFIPLAEKCGEIVNIGHWVLNQACQQCAQWNRELEREVPVSVNVSAIQFRQKGFAEQVKQVLAEHGLPPELLELEFTESLLMQNSDDVAHNLEQLRDMGVSLSLDDFGTGYSNLGYLKDFDIKALKIDKSFIFRLVESPKDRAIIAAIIQMAESLEIETIAEGIENLETADLTRELKCTTGQGFFWSKPIEKDQFLEYLKG